MFASVLGECERLNRARMVEGDEIDEGGGDQSRSLDTSAREGDVSCCILIAGSSWIGSEASLLLNRPVFTLSGSASTLCGAGLCMFKRL